VPSVLHPCACTLSRVRWDCFLIMTRSPL
jgi:hypothetical protein